MPARSTLELFTLGMEFRLRQNDHKGGWEDMTPQEIIQRMKEELAELEDAVNQLRDHPRSMGSDQRIAHDICWESFDVANVAYFLWHNISKPYRVTSGLG